MLNEIQESFEKTFLSCSLSQQVDQCEKYEIVDIIKNLFNNHNPVLEAGCGSGKWNAFLLKQRIPNVGIDWSVKLCVRAKMEIPGGNFVNGDLQNMPFKDKTFGGILSLGSIEHIITGPEIILKEFHRILKDDGKVLITTPYCGCVRELLNYIKKPLKEIRSKIRKEKDDKRTLKSISQKVCKKWHPVLQRGADGYFFYEYNFNRKQMRRFLNNCGFEIDHEFVGFGEGGVVFNFGNIAGRWIVEEDRIEFTLPGKILKTLIPTSMIGHMLCYIVSKK
jgi:SAM-dependent methyltransferase